MGPHFMLLLSIYVLYATVLYSNFKLFQLLWALISPKKKLSRLLWCLSCHKISFVVVCFKFIATNCKIRKKLILLLEIHMWCARCAGTKWWIKKGRRNDAVWRVPHIHARHA